MGFDSVGGLDQSALTTGCSTDAFVEVWYDQSGLGRHLQMGTHSNQPQLVSSGSILTERGEPALYFNGDDMLQNTNADSYVCVIPG